MSTNTQGVLSSLLAEPSLPSSRETFVTTLLLSLRARTELLRCWSPRGLRCLSTDEECSEP
jgi:hypothetical protein